MHCIVYFFMNPQSRRTTAPVLVYITYSYQIMLVISLTVTLLSECYFKTSTSILCRTILACHVQTILPLFIHYYACL